MPLDPNIILGNQQQVQLQNPMDTMSKAMAFKDLANRSQMNNMQLQQAQQEFNDKNAMRQAQANNTTVDANGNVLVDRHGTLGELANTAPHLVPQAQQTFAAADAQISKQKLESLKTQLEVGGQLLGQAKDQGSYTSSLQQMKAAGIDTSQLPAQYDPSIVSAAMNKAMTVKDHLEAQYKQQDLGIKQQELGIKSQDLALQRQKYSGENVQQTLSALQSARGNPAVSQAEKDVYSASKLNRLISDAGGADKMGPTQYKLYGHELLKAATGGQGTEEELKNLVPNTPKYRLAMLAQSITNAPSSAEAGQFIQQGQSYINGIAQEAKGLMKQNYQGVIETKKPWLPADSYKTLNNQFIGRLNGTVEPGSDWSLPGAGSGSSSGSADTNSSKATTTAASTPNIHPALQGMSLDQLNQLKQQMTASKVSQK